MPAHKVPLAPARGSPSSRQPVPRPQEKQVPQSFRSERSQAKLHERKFPNKSSEGEANETSQLKVSKRTNTKVPKVLFPNEGYQSNVIKRQFPSGSFKRTILNVNFKAKVPRRKTPSESTQANPITRNLPNEHSQVEVLQPNILNESPERQFSMF